MGGLLNAQTGGPLLPGIELSVGDTTVLTNENGFFSMQLKSGKEHLLKIEAQGYARAAQRIEVQPGTSTFVKLSLLPFGATKTINVAQGGSISTGGAEVVFPPNSLEATGEVTASLARLNADNREELAAFPGGFRTSSGELLESFGALAIEERDESGARINLMPGATAQATIPASGNVPSNDIPLWAYDEEAGVWREEGTLTGCQTGGCTAELPSLTWWNADIVMETTCLTVCAVDTHDNPAAGISFEATGVDYNGSSSAFSGTDGCACLAVRIDSEVEVTGITSGGIAGPETVATDSIPLSCGSPACATLTAPLQVAAPKFQAILTWGEKPNDLDSHFTGPCPYETGCQGSEGRFHISYSNRGLLQKEPFVLLDTDDTSSFGPEIVSLAACAEGTYRYSVHNYSGESSGPLVDSEAKVLILLPNGEMHSYEVPSSNPESLPVWIVGNLHCDGPACECTWTPVNTFMPVEEASYNP